MKSFLLLLMLFSSTVLAGTYELDDRVELLYYQQVDEGIVCINYKNADHIVKNCKFKARVSFIDEISRQSKTVRSNNFSRIAGFQEQRLCFDFSDHLKVYDPWSGEELEDEWEMANFISTSVFCCPAPTYL